MDERISMITYPVPEYVILFGGGRLLVSVAVMLRDRGMPVDVWTAPRHEAEVVGDKGETLGLRLAQEGFVAYVVTDDINRDFPLELIGPTTIGLGFGQAWSFSPDIVMPFNGRLLDVMTIPLPRYRGGAHFTWAIMNRERMWGCALQEITVNTVQGECDDGRIIWSHEYENAYSIIPSQWFEECGRQDILFLSLFFDRLKGGESFDPCVPDERASLFFPRLKTSECGWINWAWSAVEIAEFIDAFDIPYPGAHTTIDGKTVQLRRASLEPAHFHPYCSGLIVNICDDEVQIAASGGSALFVQEVIHNGTNIIKELKPGMRFTTSHARLEQAMDYQPNYTAHGDTPKEEKVEADNIIFGERICLRVLKPSDVGPAYITGLNDPEINKFLECRYVTHTQESVEAYVRTMEASANDYLLGIFLNDSLTHIGNIRIGAINDIHGYAEIGYVLFDKAHWGKGLAPEAIRLATHFAFTHLGMHRLHAGCYETHTASMKVLKKAGFTFDGIWQDQLVREGKREGHAFYSLLKDQYETVNR